MDRYVLKVDVHHQLSNEEEKRLDLEKQIQLFAFQCLLEIEYRLELFHIER